MILELLSDLKFPRSEATPQKSSLDSLAEVRAFRNPSPQLTSRETE